MTQVTADRLRGLIAAQEPPCISIYQATHRRFPDSRQNPVRFRDLVRGAERELGQKHPNRDVRAAIEPFAALAEDTAFWNHPHDGLAAFGSPGNFQVIWLLRPVPDLFEVADSFHIKPLIRILQSADRYQVLCLSRGEVRLYEGNRDALERIPTPEIPSRLADLRGEEETTRTKDVTPFGEELGSPLTPAGGAAMYQGEGERADDVAAETDRFFQVVDRMLLDQHSRPTGLPLILAALSENQSAFRKASHNPFLLPDGVVTDPFSLTDEQLREQAWGVMEPAYRAGLERLAEEFGEARAAGRGDERIGNVAEAAVSGRIATLLVEAGRHLPGRIDPLTGHVEVHDAPHPAIDDLLDDLAEITMRMGGQVRVLPGDRMPSETGLAAIYRF